MKATTVGNLDRSNKDNGMKEKDHVNLSSDLLHANVTHGQYTLQVK